MNMGTEHVGISEICKQVVENTIITEYLNDEDIRDNGFVKVDKPCVKIDGLNYTCVTRKIVPIMREVEFDKNLTKKGVIDMIKNRGYTHILSVNLHKFPYFFDNKLPTEKAVCVMFRGFTKSYETLS